MIIVFLIFFFGFEKCLWFLCILQKKDIKRNGVEFERTLGALSAGHRI